MFCKWNRNKQNTQTHVQKKKHKIRSLPKICSEPQCIGMTVGMRVSFLAVCRFCLGFVARRRWFNKPHSNRVNRICVQARNWCARMRSCSGSFSAAYIHAYTYVVFKEASSCPLVQILCCTSHAYMHHIVYTAQMRVLAPCTAT